MEMIFFDRMYGLTVNRIMSLSGHPSIINKIDFMDFMIFMNFMNIY